MRRRVLCSFIVVAMLFILCAMCACNGNGGGSQPALKEGMTLQELHDFFETVTNFTYDLDSMDSHSDEVVTELWTEKGRWQDGMTDPPMHGTSWWFWEENRCYSISKGHNIDTDEVTYSISIENMTREEFDRQGSVKQFLADFYSDCEDENVEWHIENGKLVIKHLIWHDTYTLYNFNTTAWPDVPEQYKNYKDLPLTEQ